MTRAEFSRKTKLAAFERAGGQCEHCTRKLHPGDIHYDHRVPDALRKDNDVGNCQVLCVACHQGKTSDDAATTAKANRVRAKHHGARARPKAVIPGSKASRFKKRVDGSTVRRDEE